MTQSQTLKHSENKMPSKRGWKIFFWIYLIAIVLVTGTYVYATATHQVEDVLIWSNQDWASFLISILSLTGLYGFCYEKAIWSKSIWPVILLLVLGGSIFEFVTEFGKSQGYELVVILLLITVLAIAETVALYKYSFHSPKIWDQQKTTA